MPDGTIMAVNKIGQGMTRIVYVLGQSGNAAYKFEFIHRKDGSLEPELSNKVEIDMMMKVPVQWKLKHTTKVD